MSASTQLEQTMFDADLEDDMQELSSAEDFLEYFEVEFDASVVKVNRLHILQRFHDYMDAAELPEDEDARRFAYAEMLTKAYGDFVEGDALSERVFKVLKDAVKPEGFVAMGDIKVTKS